MGQVRILQTCSNEASQSLIPRMVKAQSECCGSQCGCSEWFDFFDGTRLVNMSETALYKEDWIGLRKLDEAGKVVRDEVFPPPPFHHTRVHHHHKSACVRACMPSAVAFNCRHMAPQLVLAVMLWQGDYCSR